MEDEIYEYEEFQCAYDDQESYDQKVAEKMKALALYHGSNDLDDEI